jgi:hypothetical protein
MQTTTGLSKLVDAALCILQPIKDVFSIEEIAEIIDTQLGHKLDATALHKIKQIMNDRWGFGVEPFGIGGQVWKFGPGKPPVSRELRGR